MQNYESCLFLYYQMTMPFVSRDFGAYERGVVFKYKKELLEMCFIVFGVGAKDTTNEYKHVFMFIIVTRKKLLM